MRRFLFFDECISDCGFVQNFTRLAVFPKFYKSSSWLAVSSVAVAEKKSFNINGEEIFTSEDEPKNFDGEREGDLCSLQF